MDTFTSVFVACFMTLNVASLSTYHEHHMPYSPFPGLPGLPSPGHEALCQGRAGRVYVLPWDCTGYVRCIMNQAFWVTCPLDTRSVGVRKEPICIMERAMCSMKEAGRWVTFCSQIKAGKFPSGKSCGEYYDCSLPPERIKQTCPYPDLFNPSTERCEDFRSSESKCIDRPVPKTLCDYGHGTNTCSGSICLPCEESQPSCIGLKDGLQTIQNMIQSIYYVRCERQRTVELLRCPEGTTFVQECKMCLSPEVTSC